MRTNSIYVVASIVLCAVVELTAQGLNAHPVRRELRIAPGAHVDLETGIVLPRDKTHPFTADLVFDRDGAGFYVTPLHGGESGEPDDTQPSGSDWTTSRQYVHRNREQRNVVLFVKTDRLAVARLTVSVLDSNGGASAVLRWVLAPGKEPIFVEAPEELRVRRVGKAVELVWDGENGRYRVEVHGGEKVRTMTVNTPRKRLTGLVPTTLYRVHVRRLLPNGLVSLPASVSVLGAHKPTRRGVITYPARWYDLTGGVDVRAGGPATESADIVLYLYGVYVRGGGVYRVGRGRAVFDALSVLPAEGYLPVYSGLDERDVLAIRFRDGRHAKLLLEPTDSSDLRSGMRVHYAFLEGGGRHLIPRPERGSFRLERAGLLLEWSAVKTAVSYRVEQVDGLIEPVTTRARKLRVKGLAENRLHTFRVVAVDGGGDESDALVLGAHTFGDGYRIGQMTLDAGGRQGYRFAVDRMVAVRDREAVDLVITNSAGGASSLRFGTRHGGMGSGGEPFGTFPADAADRFQDEIKTDDRDPKTQTFWVRTGDGGIASVRIREADHPRVVLDYVWKKGAR